MGRTFVMPTKPPPPTPSAEDRDRLRAELEMPDALKVGLSRYTLDLEEEVISLRAHADAAVTRKP
jgi:hypothetical protein